jgi:RNA polymerase sigma-70 factor (ECF subfamily)
VTVDFDEPSALAAAQDGDTEAFGRLVERYQDVAYRAAYLVVRDATAAEEVAQDGFVRAYRSLHRFRSGAPFRPWLLQIVSNLARNELRARGRRRGLLGRLLRGDAPPVDPGPAPAAEAREGVELLLAAIAELPHDDQEVLYLRYYLDLPEREIADAIGRRPGTVKSRLSRASTRLRVVIEQRYPVLGPSAAAGESAGSGATEADDA